MPRPSTTREETQVGHRSGGSGGLVLPLRGELLGRQDLFGSSAGAIRACRPEGLGSHGGASFVSRGHCDGDAGAGIGLVTLRLMLYSRSATCTWRRVLPLGDDFLAGDFLRGQHVLLVEFLVGIRLEGLLDGRPGSLVLRSLRPFGAATARYCATGTSYPALAVGTSGRKELRSSEKTTSGVTLPASICGMASPSWMVETSTWLPRTAVRAG